MPSTRVSPSSDTSSSVDISVNLTRDSLYERTLQAQQHNEQWLKEVTMGTRVGFYRFRSELGSGNFSQVKLAFHQLTKQRVAVKILDKMKLDGKTHRMLTREIVVMETLHHPNIIRLYEVVETLTRIHLVMEYASGGELFAKITTQGKIPELEARHVFAQVVSAVNYMHKRNIIHRDLKAENVFYSSARTVKVGDFGFSTPVPSLDHLLNTFCGSPPYAAPELFLDERYEGIPVDLWALGVLLHFMVTGTMPFCAQTVASLKRLILIGEFSIPPSLPSPMGVVISGLLKHEPKARWTLDNVMCSEWLRVEAFSRPKDEEIPKEAEEKTKEHLKKIGIDQELLTLSLAKGNRNSISGTYYILLHRYESEMNKSEDDLPGAFSSHSSNHDEGSKFRCKSFKFGQFLNRFKTNKNCKSKMCTIF